MATLDMAIPSMFTINERMRCLQFPGKTLRLPILPNFQPPNATQNSSTFGRIAVTLVGDREIQFSQ
jgi:hypothetical protein